MSEQTAGRIPEGLTVRGAIEGEGDLEVGGRVEGTIVLGGTLRVAAGGVVAADASVRRAVIVGEVKGDVTASEAMELAAGCRVQGDLQTPRISIADAATVRGRVALGEPADAAPSGAEQAPIPHEPPPEMPASALALGDRRKVIVRQPTDAGPIA